MTAEPLHVRVASALGWTDVQSIGIRSGVEKWVGKPPLVCHIHGCGRPAACVGVYEDPTGPALPACDTCCGHGNEDGWCERLENLTPTKVEVYIGQRTYEPIPPFGEETPEGWACTGPLMARFKMDVITWSIGSEEAWRATHGPYREISLSLLEAVCNLVLALAEAGRLRLADEEVC